jgi:hypothetical protein
MTERNNATGINTGFSLNNKEVRDVIGTEIPKTVNSLIDILKENDFPYPIEEKLGNKSIKNRDVVIDELNTLNRFLTQYQRNPDQFDTRVVSFDKNSGIYRINLGFGQKVPIDQRGENQISFILREPVNNLDRDDSIYSASLHGRSPSDTLDFISNNNYSIQINTSHIYMGKDARIKIDPYAGIVNTISKKGVNSSGIHFIGAVPFYTRLNESIDVDQFKTVRQFIKDTPHR